MPGRPASAASTGIQPPAMTGDPELERALRVQGNTVEQFVIFLPALWLATLYFQGWVPPIAGPGLVPGPRSSMSSAIWREASKRGTGLSASADPGDRIGLVADVIGWSILGRESQSAGWPRRAAQLGMLSCFFTTASISTSCSSSAGKSFSLTMLGPSDGRMVGILVHFHEDAGHARRHRGARQIGHHGAVAAGLVALPARLLHRMGGVEHHRRAEPRHDRQRPHVGDQRVVAEARRRARSPAHWDCRRR